LVSLDPTKDTNYSLSKITKAASRTVKYIPPIRTTNGSWARTDKDKAEAFATYLTKVFTPHKMPTTVTPTITDCQHEYRIPHIQPAEI